MPRPSTEATSRGAPDDVLTTRARRISRGAAALAALIAALALVGWAIGSRPLLSIVAGLTPMAPVTAIGVLLTAAALSLLAVPAPRRPARDTGRILALGAAALGAVIIASYITGTAPDLARLLFPETIERLADSTAAGRPAPLTGLVLILAGAALLLLPATGRTARWVAQIIAVGIGFLALLVVASYLYGAERFYGLPVDRPMAPNTAIAFLVLAAGLLSVHPRDGLMSVATADDVGGEVARRLLPVAVLVPLLLGLLRLLGQVGGLYGTRAGLSLLIVATIGVQAALIWWTARTLKRLDARRRAVEADRLRLVESERRSRSDAVLRAREEETLRRAAERIAAAFSVDAVVKEAARNALQATGADLAFVERIHHDTDELEIVSAAGRGAPRAGRRVPYSGSLAERVIRQDRPILLRRIEPSGSPILGELVRTCRDCSALVVPLLDAGEALGVLILVRRAERRGFRRDEIARALIFGNLASLAFRKIHLYEDSERRRRELEQAVESRERLIRGFSHDLKNPLGAADGYAELLEDGVLGEIGPRQREGIQRIRRSLHTALELIDDLVELARAEAGQLEFEWSPTDVLGIVREVVEEHRARAEAEGLALELELPERMEPIRSDAGRLRQMLGNLLSNAVKYTPEGGRITVRVRACERSTDGSARDAAAESRPPGPGPTHHDAPAGWVCIDVSDTGPGIPEDRREEIFQKFARVAPGPERGAGLGLAMSRRIARLMGGDITVESRLGRGSTFTIRLPRTAERPTAAEAAGRGGAGGPPERAAADGGRADESADPRRDAGHGWSTDRTIETLRRSEELFRLLVESELVGLVATDPDGRIVLWNRGAERITGRGSRDVVGEDVAILFSPEARERGEPQRLLDAARDAADGRVQGEYRLVRRDGSTLAADTAVMALCGEERPCIGFAIGFFDLTARKRVEAGRREAEERYRILSRATTDVIWDWDVPSGRLVWNEAVRTTFRYAPADVGSTIQWWEEHVHPDDRDRVVRGLAAVLEGGEREWTDEYRFRRGDGSYAAVVDRGAVIRDEAGRAVRMIGSMVDITERKRAERERERLLRQIDAERARLETVIRSVPTGVIMADAASGKIVLSNPEAERILGHPVPLGEPLESWAADRVFDADGRIVPPESWPLNRALSGATTRTAELRYRRDDGSTIWLRIGSAPIRGAGGEITGAVTGFFDITEARRSEEAQGLLAEAGKIMSRSIDVEDTLQDLAGLLVERFADDCVIDIQSPAGRIDRVAMATRDPDRRPRFEELRRFPPTPDNCLARILIEGRSVLKPRVTDEWLRSIADSEQHLALLRTLAPESAMLVPIIARGETFGVLTLGTTRPGRRFDRQDLTLAEELATRIGLAMDNTRLYEAVVVASQAKSDFLAVMSHELRTPLNAIIGFADLLLLDVPKPLPEEDRRPVNRIIASARHLRELIDEILSYSRMEAGREEVVVERADLAELVRDVASSAEAQAREKRLAFHLDLPDGPAPIETDPDKLRQILLNVLSNAVKFTDRGRIDVTARVEDDEVVIRVRDTGIGIAPEHRERIFEPFWQVERGATRGVTGTGLGLSVSRRLARLLGGDVSVESRLGEGSTFTIRLPARTEATRRAA